MGARAMRKIILAGAASVATLLTSHSVLAQEVIGTSSVVIEPGLSRQDAAGMRQEREYDSTPIDAGAFLLAPSISAVTSYDSNILNRSNSLGDGVLVLAPRLNARANTSRHLLELSTNAVIRRFRNTSSENSEQFGFRGRSVFDLSEGNELFANASYSREIEPRSSVGNIANAAETVSYNWLQTELGGTFSLGDISVTPSASYRRLNYRDLDLTTGNTLDLSFRDTRAFGGNLRVAYDLGGNFSVFSSAGYSESKSINPVPGTERGSQTLTVLAGIRGDISPLVTGEVAIGYRDRDYDSPQFLGYEGITYRANIEWYPTQLVSFSFDAEQRFINGGTTQVAGILSNRFSANAYYDPLRNLRIAATAALIANDYREIDTTATRPSMRLQAQYRLTPNVSLGMYASYMWQDVSGTPIVNDFNSFSAGIGVSLTP